MNMKPQISLDFWFARQSTKTVILRRGPSKLYRMILWDRKDDSFKDGQWFKGQVFAGPQSLSPDGEHFIYCAADNKPKGLGRWTAISRPPYFTAIALYPTSFYRGTGRFLSEKFFEVFAPSDVGDVIGHTGKLERVLQGEKTKDNALGYVKYNGNRVPLSREDRQILLDNKPAPNPMENYHVEAGKLYRRVNGGDAEATLELIRDISDMEFENIRAPYDTRPTRLSKPVIWHPLEGKK